MKQVVDEYGDKVRLVIKFAPFSFRDFSKNASRAALAAREQGKFWEMHEKLLENFRNLEDKVIQRIAVGLKLDMKRFAADMKSEKIVAAVEADIKLCDEIPINATPTTFFNGRRELGAKDAEEYRRIIDEELALVQKKN